MVTGPKVGSDERRAGVAGMGVGNPSDVGDNEFRVRGLEGADTLRTTL